MTMQPLTTNADPKILGAFYTPSTIADMLAEWAVRDGNERILEPSVGGGALISACEDAAARKSTDGKSHLEFLACDVDPIAIRQLRTKQQSNLELRAVDFLQLDANRTGKFTAVVANPPFTRNHALDARWRHALRSRFEISGAAGLWVHFLAHSIEFVRPGGRLAFVVPSAALFTLYGHKALNLVSRSFSEMEIRQFVDQPFWTNGAIERGALILANGRGGSCSLPKPKPWTSDGLPAHQASSSSGYDALQEYSRPLGELARLSIGAVTGCNSKFLMSEAERQAYGVHEEDLRPVVSRARQLRGLIISESRLQKLDHATENVWLISPRDLDRERVGIRRRLAEISKERRRGTIWFSKRTPWWNVSCGESPDAIFTYMNGAGPRIALTRGDVWCTNTLHSLVFRRGASRNEKIGASLSLVSTFGALAAEKTGRVYGGGLLKFELIEARQLPILNVRIDLKEAYRKADAALRDGNECAARRIADAALIDPIMDSKAEKIVSEMTEELECLRRLRTGRGIMCQKN